MSRQRNPANTGPDETLCVTITHVRYQRQNGSGKEYWIIASTDKVPIKGTIAWIPKTGERLKLSGKWTAYQGERQFEFKAAIPDIPTDLRGKLAYVCEITTGIGAATETAIWEAKGEAWESITDGEIPELKGNKFRLFKETLSILESNQAKVKAISYLMGKGSTPKMAAAAWELWGERTIGIVESNCYRLTDLSHYGFVHVDRDIRNHFGITDLDPRRIRAALDYSLSSLINKSGDTAIGWGMIVDEAVRNLRGIDRALLADHAGELLRTGEWAGWNDTMTICRGIAHTQEMDIWRFSKQVESEVCA